MSARTRGNGVKVRERERERERTILEKEASERGVRETENGEIAREVMETDVDDAQTLYKLVT